MVLCILASISENPLSTGRAGKAPAGGFPSITGDQNKAGAGRQRHHPPAPLGAQDLAVKGRRYREFFPEKLHFRVLGSPSSSIPTRIAHAPGEDRKGRDPTAAWQGFPGQPRR